MNKYLSLLLLSVSLVFMGAGCGAPETIEFNQNSTNSSQGQELRSLDEAKSANRYVNEAYAYSFALNDGLKEPLSLDYLKDAEEATIVRLTEVESNESLQIEVQDPETLTLAHLQEQMQLPLEQFADSVHQLNQKESSFNSDTKEVSNLSVVEFAGQNAYTFTATENFKTPRGERRFDQEMTILFLNHQSISLILTYPTANSGLKSLAETLEFHV